MVLDFVNRLIVVVEQGDSLERLSTSYSRLYKVNIVSVLTNFVRKQNYNLETAVSYNSLPA